MITILMLATASATFLPFRIVLGLLLLQLYLFVARFQSSRGWLLDMFGRFLRFYLCAFEHTGL
jgi:hypothetical protein